MVEEPVLRPPEEVPHGRANGAAPLLQHRPDRAVLLANRNPSGPAAMTASVRVGHGPLPIGERCSCGPRAAVRELRVRGRVDRPGGKAYVEAVEDGRRVHFAAR